MSAYANQIRYEFDQHQVRLTFMDKQAVFEEVVGAEMGQRVVETASVVMTRQSFRAFLQILTEMAERMPPIGIPYSGDRDDAAQEFGGTGDRE